jgi:hypothetical protein
VLGLTLNHMTFTNDMGLNSLIAHWGRRREHAHRVAMTSSIGSTALLFPPSVTQVSLTGLAAQVLIGNVRVAEELTAELVDDTERLRPAVERLWNELKTGQDEAGQRLTLQNFVRAAFEGSTGQKLRLDTPVGRVRLFTWVVRILIVWMLAQQASQLLDQKQNRIVDLLEHHAPVITALAETVRQLQQEHEEQHHTELPKPSLRVADTVNLREGPSSDMRRVAVLRAGVMLEEIVRVNRWYYVEVLANDGQRTRVRGWVYRRNVRRVQ